MNKDKLLKTGLIFAIGAGIMLCPVPNGLTPEAWKMFAIFFATILGLILKPFSEPVIMLTAITASSLLLGNLKGILRGGYADSTPWLVFAAFSLSTAFTRTNLGRRLAYLIMYKIGHSTLGIGYVAAFIELILAPATPANTARAGGIVFPILNSVAQTLGSEPGPTARKSGAYFMVALWNLTKTSSYMFMTAMGGNIIAVAVCKSVLGLDVDWTNWAIAASVPGLLMLLGIPLAIYIIYPPELKKIDGKSIAVAGLKDLGPMSLKEKMLVGIFVLALLGWIFGGRFKIDATTVGLGAMVGCLLLGIIDWNDVLSSKGAWSTLLWFGGIIGLSSVLSQSGFFKWMAKVLGDIIPTGIPPYLSLCIIIFLSIVVRYFFASGSAYIAAMMPVFLAVGGAAGAPAGALVYFLLFTNAYGGMVTHYGGAAGPILFGSGYTDVKSWWMVGGVMALLTYIVHMTVGVLWLQMIGFY